MKQIDSLEDVMSNSCILSRLKMRKTKDMCNSIYYEYFDTAHVNILNLFGIGMPLINIYFLTFTVFTFSIYI